MSAETCAVDGCTKPRRTRGWCSGHYTRWYRYGDVAGRPHGNTQRSLTVEDIADLYRDGWTQAEIAAEAGITNERVRQLLPEGLSDEVKKARWWERRDQLAALIAEGWFRSEIAEECGYSHLSNLYVAFRHYDLAGEWEAASVRRRERRTEDNGPCRVCGSLAGDRDNAVTCGDDLCERVWQTRALSRRLDPEVLRKHRVHTALWRLQTGRSTSTPEADLAIVELDGDIVTDHGGWFVEGSQSLALAAECVRREYEPVIDALCEREMAQVREYLNATGERAGVA